MAVPGRKPAKHEEGIQSQWQRLGYIIRLASLGSKALRFAQTPYGGDYDSHSLCKAGQNWVEQNKV